MITEDEFIVLLEHAGLVETGQGTGEEFVEKKELLLWLESEGSEHFDECFFGKKAAELSADSLQSSSSPILPTNKAQRILERVLQKEWLLSVKSDTRAVQNDPRATRYHLHLSTVEAYQMYLDKDLSVATPRKSNTSVIQTVVIFSNSGSLSHAILDLKRGKIPDEAEKKSEEKETCAKESESNLNKRLMSANNASSQQVRRQMWQECFPMCAPACRDAFFSFESKTVILYATLGLNLIQNGISTVPAFSRELKNIGLDASDRSIITRFLAKAFPCD